MSQRDYSWLCQMGPLSKTSKLTSGGSITTQQSELCFMEEAVLCASIPSWAAAAQFSAFYLVSFLNPCLFHTESGAAVVSVPNGGLFLLQNLRLGDIVVISRSIHQDKTGIFLWRSVFWKEKPPPKMSKQRKGLVANPENIEFGVTAHTEWVWALLLRSSFTWSMLCIHMEII